MEHQMLSWLRYDVDAKGTHVVSLYCAICKKCQANIQLLKKFRRDWIVGSTNQRTNNLIDHATSDAHKAVMAMLKVKRSRVRSQSAATSTMIRRFLSSMDDETRERMAKKFIVCFMMAKESLPFTKYPALLELESRHGVDLGPACQTSDLANTFTSYNTKSQRQTFLNALSCSGSRRQAGNQKTS